MDTAWLDAHLNLGVILQELDQPDEARAHLEAVLQLHPQDQRARFNLGLLQLRAGQLADGLASYEYRFCSAPKRPFTAPLWTGEDLGGKTLLIWDEQGIGDEIMFASMFAEVVIKAGHCIIECATKLQPLFARSFPTAQVVCASTPPHPATQIGVHYQCPAGSLARWLYPTIAHIPGHPQYLKPDPLRAEHWRKRFAALGSGLKIGFCWRSSLNKGSRALQYATLDQWEPLFKLPGTHFVNLQYDECSAELAQARQQFGVPLHVFPEVDMYHDLDETAALIQSLDIVITAATAVASLAGALGVPTWVMSYGEVWTMLGTDKDAFVPSLHHVIRRRQQTWADVIAQIATSLQSNPLPNPTTAR